MRPFRQVDVFAEVAYTGNPVAVVLGADGIADETMQRVANWTNLSETTFVLAPTADGADYRVRIFTPARELPFAGHPTLGTCHAWLEQGGAPADDHVVVQECGAGLVRIRRAADGLAFAAPPLVRSGPLEPTRVAELVDLAGVDPAAVVDAALVDNGPGWVALLLASVDDVAAARPRALAADELGADIGLVALHPPGGPAAIEVRAFFPGPGTLLEDPVTGSLNASLAAWLLETGRVTSPYVAAQGRALGRAGRVQIAQDDDGTIWVGGGTITTVVGTVEV